MTVSVSLAVLVVVRAMCTVVGIRRHGDCEGGSGRFYWDPETGNEGTYYGQEDLIFGGLRDNSMHSL